MICGIIERMFDFGLLDREILKMGDSRDANLRLVEEGSVRGGATVLRLTSSSYSVDHADGRATATIDCRMDVGDLRLLVGALQCAVKDAADRDRKLMGKMGKGSKKKVAGKGGKRR